MSPSLAEIQEEAAGYGAKVTDGSARLKAIGIVGGVAPQQRQSTTRQIFPVDPLSQL